MGDFPSQVEEWITESDSGRIWFVYVYRRGGFSILRWGGFTKIVRFSKNSDLLDISNFTGDPLFGLILWYDSEETDGEFRTSISRGRGEIPWGNDIQENRLTGETLLFYDVSRKETQETESSGTWNPEEGTHPTGTGKDSIQNVILWEERHRTDGVD